MSDKLIIIIYVDDVLVYARDNKDIDDLIKKNSKRTTSFCVKKVQQKGTLESRLKETAEKLLYHSQV